VSDNQPWYASMARVYIQWPSRHQRTRGILVSLTGRSSRKEVPGTASCLAAPAVAPPSVPQSASAGKETLPTEQATVPDRGQGSQTPIASEG